MIEVQIAGIQINLMSQHRVVLLKELDTDRYLTIWVGAFEAEAINIKLQNVDFPRPLTHDLLKNIIHALGGAVKHIAVTALRDETFHAEITLEVDGREMVIDSRPSDAMALAVRTDVPIYVAEEVMEEAGIRPEQHIGEEGEHGDSAFEEFLDSLDIDDLPIH